MQFHPGTTATTLILLHGTGGSERDLVPIGRKLAPNAALLSIGGRVTENGQARYFRHLPDGGYDFADLATQTTWLLATIQAALATHHRDAARAVVVGYSNGANIAAYAMAHRLVPWRDAVLFHPLALDAKPATQPLHGSHVWLSHGTGDPYADAANFAQLTTMLKAAGAATTTFTHDRGHQLTPAELKAATQWCTQSGVART